MNSNATELASDKVSSAFQPMDRWQEIDPKIIDKLKQEAFTNNF
jgi:hypothetical protein